MANTPFSNPAAGLGDAARFGGARSPAVSGGRPGGLPNRDVHPGPGDQPERGRPVLYGPVEHHPRHREHVLRWRAVTPVHLRDGRHAVHLGLDHHSDDVDGDSVADGAGKEGESGRRKITEYTRYATVILAAFQSFAAAGALAKGGLTLITGWQFLFTATVTMTTGTLFLMWLGEQITERGIGNGISMIILAGIVAGFPAPSATQPRL